MVISDVKSLNSVFKDLYEEKVSSLIPDGVSFYRQRIRKLDCGIVVFYHRKLGFSYYTDDKEYTREEAKQYISKYKTKIAGVL